MTEEETIEGDEQYKKDIADAPNESEDDTTNVDESKEEESTKDESTEEESNEESEDTDSPEIPVRDSATQIINRQKRTIEKLRDGQKEDESVDEDATDYDEDDAQSEVQKEVEKQMAPLRESLVEKSDEDELTKLFSERPDSKGYEKRIRAFMAHENYQGVPPEFIYNSLASAEAEKRGAEQKAAADLEAEQMGGTGSTSRPADRPSGDLPTAEEIVNMSDEDFEALEHKARTGGFIKD